MLFAYLLTVVVAVVTLYASFAAWADHGGSVRHARALGAISFLLSLVAIGAAYFLTSWPFYAWLVPAIMAAVSGIVVTLTWLPQSKEN